MITKLPPQLITSGTPLTLLGTDQQKNAVEYPIDTYGDGRYGMNLVWFSGTQFRVNPGIRGNMMTGISASLTSVITKTINAAWSQGNNNGALDTGAIISGKLYHVFVIQRTSNNAVDILASLSHSAPVVPTGWNLVARLGTIFYRGSIVRFSQTGNKMMYAGVPNGGSASSYVQTVLFRGPWTNETNTLTFTAESMPTGIPITCIYNFRSAMNAGEVVIHQCYPVGNSPVPGNPELHNSFRGNGIENIFSFGGYMSCQSNQWNIDYTLRTYGGSSNWWMDMTWSGYFDHTL